MGYEDAKADVKKTMREADEKAKETWRRADGEESVSDKVANLGDDIRNELGNAGDNIRRDADELHEDVEDKPRLPPAPTHYSKPPAGFRRAASSLSGPRAWSGPHRDPDRPRASSSSPHQAQTGQSSPTVPPQAWH